MAQTNARYTVPDAAGALVRRTTAGVLVALAALIGTQTLVEVFDVGVGPTEGMSPFATGELVGATVVAGIGAALTYTALVWFTSWPVRNFVRLSALVFLLMLVPIIVVAPTMGVTPTGQLVLVLYHLFVAVPLAGFVVGAIEV